MIDLDDLHKTWSLIAKNRDLKTDNQVINFYRAVHHGKVIVKDVTREMLTSMAEEDAEMVKRINLLFDITTGEGSVRRTGPSLFLNS